MLDKEKQTNETELRVTKSQTNERDFYYYYYAARKAPYINCSEAMNRWHEWPYVVVTIQVQATIYCVRSVCVCVCVCV